MVVNIVFFSKHSSSNVRFLIILCVIQVSAYFCVPAEKIIILEMAEGTRFDESY